MKLYNSLKKEVEDFTEIEKGTVRMYSCGPTVYNNLHIGNLSAFIYADLLRRTLTVNGYKVRAVMNITDVDDKTIRDSKRDYPDLDPMEALQTLTRKYEEVFLADITRIGNDTDALTFIRATETIDEMIRLTQKLLDEGIAYPAEDGIYFSIMEYELAGYTYGQLQTIDRSHEHARIANDEYDKDSASDFALWKKAEKGEPSWDAAFTHKNKSIDMAGRPGWHIECSAMSERLLGVPFDIHTGGIDLKFPHHENEIAQSSGASGEQVFANYFVHNNHILIDGKKMSKSLGNVYTLRDIEDKGFDPLALRLLVLSSHYRSESNFTWEILEAAQNRLRNWQATANLRWQPLASNRSMNRYVQRINVQSLLEEDLDTPRALALVDAIFGDIERTGFHQDESNLFEEFLSYLNLALGINLLMPNITDEQKQLISEREKAREKKDWAKSDELRDALKAQGIDIRDTANGQIWSYLYSERAVE